MSVVFVGYPVNFTYKKQTLRGVIEAVKMDGYMKVKIRAYDWNVGKWLPLGVIQKPASP